MRTTACAVFVVALCWNVASNSGEAQDKTRPEDRAAIREALGSFTKTLEARDAKALAAHFTDEGEFENVQGRKRRGRAALERAFAEFFARTPEVKAVVHPETLRFLSNDSAIDEGTVSVQRGPVAPAAAAHYTALVVREGRTWRLARLSESPGGDETSIDDLGWLIGQWKSIEPGGTAIQTTYSWDAGKKFIQSRFAVGEKSLDVSGTQMIGLDPETGMIHSWTFEANGGIGEAVDA